MSRRRFTKEFKLAAVSRLQAGESGSALARGPGRRPNGSTRVEPGGEAQARVAELERKVGRQAMEIDFLSAALRRVEDLRRPHIVSGTSVSLAKYGQQGGKANEAK